MAPPIKQLIQEALKKGVFPGGVLIASMQREVVVREIFGCTDYTSGTPTTAKTVYDLASLTKPLATTLAVIHLMKAEKLHLDQRLGDLLPESRGGNKDLITVENLLAHRSGLPDYRPYFQDVTGETALEWDKTIQKRLLDEPLVYPVDSKTVYSDLGFMLLRRLVEQVSGTRLDKLVGKGIYGPMGIDNLFFPGGKRPEATFEIAPTEMCPWRNYLIYGEVHDENAFAVGGVDGHAGLFGTVSAVHALLLEILDAYNGGGTARVLPENLVRIFLDYGKNGERALGFDRPNRKGSSSGRYFSDNSVGHLGFTGTSFWMDLDRDIIVVLLTNRVHPSRDNDRIKTFRPQIHDAVMQLLTN